MTIPASRVFQWLESVPDPEVPVLSIVDLGIVRHVHWEEDRCVITITPTYSGCPAMQEIAQGIQLAVVSHGVEKVRIDTQLSPAWTTDWLSDRGRAALRAYGIAPPAERAVDISGLVRRKTEPSVPCPHCGSSQTQVISQFGSTACKALYQCRDCREPFDYFKAH